jgi:glycosyltransferase involved in cell wall biosynthesis
MFKRLFGKEPDCQVPHTDKELIKLAVLKKKLNGRKVVCNLTSIPPRFKYLPSIIENLKTHHIFDDIVVFAPRVYTRFPGEFTDVYTQQVDQDYGPATRIINARGDIVVYCDDDTQYSHMTSLLLIEKYLETGACCGTSGFNFKKYFIGDFSKQFGEEVQVIEGYGMVVCNPQWIDQIRDEFIKLTEHTYNDDMIFSNLLDKIGVKKLIFPIRVNQLEYGFDEHALHYNAGEKSHIQNNKRILETFRKMDKMYFTPCISYGICVCDEANELDQLLYTLDQSIVHVDEVVLLVDTNRVTENVQEVIKKYPWIKVYERKFDGNFANHKNVLNQMCKGTHVFNIDADEVPSYSLIENMYKLCEFDIVYVPRVNIIQGCTPNFLRHHSFSLSKEGFINWPDYQGRIYNQKLSWSGNVHEKIQGARKVTQIQPDPNASIWHIKTMKRMNDQNALYQKLASETHE